MKLNDVMNDVSTLVVYLDSSVYVINTHNGLPVVKCYGHVRRYMDTTSLSAHRPIRIRI